MPTMAPTAMAWPTTATAMVLPTMDTDMANTTAMPIPMPTTDTTARGPLMLRLLPRLMLMPTMAPTATVWLITDTAMVLPITVMATMDITVMPIPMPTTDTTARGLLMPLLLLMLTMALMAMVWLTTDMAMVMDTPTTAMPTMDTTDIPTPM